MVAPIPRRQDVLIFAFLYMSLVGTAYAAPARIHCLHGAVDSVVVDPNSSLIHGRAPNGIFVMRAPDANDVSALSQEQVKENILAPSIRLKGTSAIVFAFGPLLADVDSRNVVTEVTCTQSGFRVLLTVDRHDSINPILRHNIGWWPTAKITLSLAQGGSTQLNVEWIVRSLVDGASKNWVATKILTVEPHV